MPYPLDWLVVHSTDLNSCEAHSFSLLTELFSLPCSLRPATCSCRESDEMTANLQSSFIVYQMPQNVK